MCEEHVPSHVALLKKLKNNKTGGSDGLVGELLKYGGSGMIHLLHKLFEVVWSEELAGADPGRGLRGLQPPVS